MARLIGGSEMFKLEIETANAAFTNSDQDAEFETARILREIASKLESGTRSGKCVDGNGNTVGDWTIS
jgi:hypothetical protein